MWVLCVNTKKHLETLAPGRDLAEIFPCTSVASGKWCVVPCFYFQGYLNPLQAGVTITLELQKMCLESPRLPQHYFWANRTYTRAGHKHLLPTSPRPAFLPPEAKYLNRLLSLLLRCRAGSWCRDCKWTRDLSQDPLETVLEVCEAMKKACEPRWKGAFSSSSNSCHLGLGSLKLLSSGTSSHKAFPQPFEEDSTQVHT